MVRLDIAASCNVRFTYDWYDGPHALAVFENLLPEGTLRDALGQATKHHPNDTVGLLGVVGGEWLGVG